MLEWEKVVRNIALKFLVKILFTVKSNHKKFYSHVKDVVCSMRLGNCRLLWKMPSAVTGVNIITNRKHVVHRDTRRGFSSRYVLFQITLRHIKFYPKAPKIFLMLTVQQAIEISFPSWWRDVGRAWHHRSFPSSKNTNLHLTIYSITDSRGF